MSGTPDANSDREGFTCSALFMCLYPPGRSKKKPEEEEASPSRPPVETGPAPDQPEPTETEQEPSKSRPPVETGPAPDQPEPTETEQEPSNVQSRAASLEKFECASLSGNNIVFDFVVEEEEQQGVTPAVQGYCPSPCFDLPVELIRAGERYGTVAAASTAPVTTAFVFGDYSGAALKKMASCLAAGVEGKETTGPPHLVRFLSATGYSVPRPPLTPSRAALQMGTADDGGSELAGGACVQRQSAGDPEPETVS